MELVDELLNAGRDVTRARRAAARPARPRGGAAPRAASRVEGDIRDAGRPRGARSRAPTRSSTWRRSSATPPARWTRRSRTRSTSRRRSRSPPRPRAGVERFVFASTCSNYGRMADPTTPIDETGVLAPVSLYAEQKVGDRAAPARRRTSGRRLTCLRFATVYGVAPRMRFDLTVNEFTRDLWADRDARGLRRAVLAPVRARPRRGRAASGRCSRRRASRSPARCSTSATRARTTASSTSSRRSASRPTAATVSYVSRDEDPRDYKVSFEQGPRGGSATRPPARVPDGIAEVAARARRGALPATRSTAATATSRDVRSARRPRDPAVRPPHRARRTSTAVADALRAGLADAGRRGSRRSSASSPSTSASPRASRVVELHGGAAPRLPRRGRRAGRRGHRARHHLRGHRRGGASTAARRRCSPTSPATHDLGVDPDDVERRITPRTQGGLRRALRRLPRGRRGAARAVRRARPRADRGRRARAARAPRGAGKAGTFGLAGASASSPTRCCRPARAGCSPPTTTRVADARAARAPRRRPRPPARRAARRAAALAHRAHGRRHRARAARSRCLPRAARRRRGRDRPLHGRGGRARLLLRDAGRARRPRAPRPAVRGRHARAPRDADVASSTRPCTSSPPTRTPAASLPRAERIARSELTLPLYSHLTEAEQDRVVAALADGLAT